MWEILKEAIGKDITKITMPILLNEPISMLQKVSEILQNFDLMEKANSENEDNLKRMAYMTAFNITQYQTLETRNLKPFNPILGETFELYEPGKYTFLAE